MGVDLFARDTRHVALTDAGEALLPRARRLLADADAVTADLRATATPIENLTVGMLCFGLAELNARLVGAFLEAFDEAAVRSTNLRYGDQVAALVQGRLDVLLLPGVLEDDRLEQIVVGHEPRVAVISERDELADAASLSVADLLSRPFLRSYAPATAKSWADYWMLGDQRPVDEAEVVEHEARTLADAHSWIARLGVTGTAPASVARFAASSDVRFSPLHDAPDAPMTVAVRRERPSRGAAAFREIASALPSS